MKLYARFIILLTLVCFSCINIHAQGVSIRAAEISYQVTGNNQIAAQIILYTKVSGYGGSDYDYAIINWGDGTNDSLGRINGPQDPNTGYPHYGVLVSPEIKESIYSGPHTYNGLPQNGFYILSFQAGNRTAGINNISDGNSVDVPFYIEDTIWFPDINNVGLDNSPVFLNPPCDYANVNDIYSLNPVAYDANGDSMVFELKVPLDASGADVPLYQYPSQYCTALGDPSGQLSTETVNSLTGQYMWAVPCVTGFFNIAFLVRTFRCGIELGTVELDMQIVVLQDSDSPPIISTVNDTIISPGETVQWQFTASDPNATDTVSLSALGGAFLLPSDTPNFQSVSGNPATGTLTWQPNDSAMRPNAYIFSVLATDNYVYEADSAPLANYSTFRVWVADTAECTATTGITQVAGNEAFVSLYPNPSSGSCRLQVSNELVGTSMEILDAAGRVVYSSRVNSTASEIDLNAAPGVYLLRVYSPTININKKIIRL